MPARTLIIGLGNSLLRDDAVGLRVASQVRAALGGREDVEVVEEACGGLRLMERMVGFDRAILIDAIRSGRPPGTVVTQMSSPPLVVPRSGPSPFWGTLHGARQQTSSPRYRKPFLSP